METHGSKLTQKRVGLAIREALRTRRDVTVWCVEPRGFGCRARPSGSASFIFQFRTPGGRAGRTQKITIGRSTVFTPEEARVIARGHAQSVALGRDPRRPDEDPAEDPADAAPTLRELFDLYVTQNVGRLSSKTVDGMRSHLRVQLAAFVDHPIDAIRRIDIASAHAEQIASPYAANRALATLSTLFGFAERMELRPVGSNPARGVRRHREAHRERFLQPEEIAALWRVLVKLEAKQRHRFAALAIRVGLLTGWRVGEVRTLTWSDVDLDRADAVISGKTGARRAPLSPPVQEILTGLKRVSAHYGLGEHHGVYVFPSTSGRTAELGPLSDWEHRRTWDKAVGMAGVSNVRRHDLRHLVAGVIGMQTGSALRVKEAMGHRSVAVSERYVSPVSALQRESADRAAALIVAFAGETSEHAIAGVAAE